MSEDISPGKAIRRFIGGVLIVVGLLWLGASGLCSAVLFVSLLVDSDGAYFREVLSIVPMFLLVGGFSAGVGFAVYAIGRVMRPKT